MLIDPVAEQALQQARIRDCHPGVPITVSQTIVAAICGAEAVLKWTSATEDELQAVFKPGDKTFVTVIDRESGTAIKDFIRRLHPDHSINEEETGREEGTGKALWLIDPLDGTSSALRGQRYSTVGVASFWSEPPNEAVIINPYENELVFACQGGGVNCYDLQQLIKAINHTYEFYLDCPAGYVFPKPGKAKVSTKTVAGGIVYVDALFNDQTSPRKIEFMRRLVELSGGNIGFRMTGSNIDQQRQVACGRAELTLTDAVGGYWDLAIGALVIEEAGGLMVGVDGNSVNEQTQVAIGGPVEIIKQVLPLLQACYASYEGFKKA